MITERADGAILVTTARFSAPAQEFADQHGIILYNGGRTVQLFQEAFPPAEHPDIVWAVCPRCGERVLVDTRDRGDSVICSGQHKVPYPVPDVIRARWHAGYRSAMRERAKNPDMDAFFARAPERERQAIADAQAAVQRTKAGIAFDRRWADLRMKQTFETREKAERVAAIINVVLRRADDRERGIPALEATVHELQATHEERERLRAETEARRS
jgi:hypothetical protein